MTRNNMNTRTVSSERARAITAAKKASAKKKRMIVSITAFALVVVAAASFIIPGIIRDSNKPAATVTSTTASVQASKQPVAAVNQSATQAPAQDAGNASYLIPESAVTPDAPEYPDWSDYEVDSLPESAVRPDPVPSSEDRIDTINGERVYIDTKRPVPAESGILADFYATGRTSYGFDWTYTTDNCIFVLRCDYYFDRQQYDFQVCGVAPGVAHLTIWYNTDDNVQVPAELTVYIDDDLNAAIV